MAAKPLSYKRKKTPSAAPGERLYVIGDVHGRYDLLRDLLRRIERHSRGRPDPESLHVVLLGDVVDRGPDSAKVLRFLFDWSQNTTGAIMLLGNHEEMMLRAVEGDRRVLRPWIRMGGRETLESFGLTIPDDPARDRAFMSVMRAAVPEEMTRWIRGWPVSGRSGDYYFCHAGVRPGVALDKQSRSDLLWIREEFLHFRGDFGAAVVHGHTISNGVDWQENRIGIDTGAYETGILTALYVEGTERDVLSTGADALDRLTALAS